MKPEQLYQSLKDLAEKLNISVSERNFRNTGIHVESGFCIIKGKYHIILDKHLSVFRKNKIIASGVNKLPHEHIYIVPAVREFLEKHSDQSDQVDIDKIGNR